jgi:hypothetical protein
MEGGIITTSGLFRFIYDVLLRGKFNKPLTEERAPLQQDLLQLLVDKEIISAAQAAVARGDMERTCLSPQEVLLIRKWVSEEVLSSIAPPPGEPAKPSIQSEKENAEKIYRRNLERYRQIMAEILNTKSKQNGKSKDH